MINATRAAKWSIGGEKFFITGEDLTCQAGLGVQQLGDVAEIGQLPLAVGNAKQPRRDALAHGYVREERGHSAPTQEPRPGVQSRVDLFPVVFVR